MRTSLSFAAAALLALHSIPTASAQADSPAKRLLLARATYYTPTANGLKSFSCNVDFDWKAFLENASGEQFDDTNPFLIYVKTVRLSVTDDLHGAGRLIWATNGLPPEAQAKEVNAMREGMQQMLEGFFQSWNTFMNGGMVSADAASTVTRAGEGLVVHAKQASTEVTQNFDKNILLTEAHMTTAELDATIYPTYIDTEDGRVVSLIRAMYRTPPTAPPTEISMGVQYAMVSSFRLPSVVTLSVKNTGAFTFAFKDCAVKR